MKTATIILHEPNDLDNDSNITQKIRDVDSSSKSKKADYPPKHTDSLKGDTAKPPKP